MKIPRSKCGGQRSNISASSVNFSLVVPLCSSVSTVMASNPGLSGLCIQASVAVTLQAAGNGDSTNGSSDMPHRPRK